MLSRQPPARLVLGIACPCQPARRRQAQDGQQIVHAVCRQSRNERRVKHSDMESLFIHGRIALTDASDLIERYGDDAGFEAAMRAERSRDQGNVLRFCHWRQIERVIATLSSDEVQGTVH